MQIVTGAFDYNTALKNVCNNLAKEGIKTVQYRNGKPVTLSIENAVRMNILTGVNQTASTITLNNCEELNCDLVETTAHIGARPEHQAWQGQIFSISGKSNKYPSFYDVCKPGTATGICGINCRHSYYPYFEGQEKHYTQEDLDEIEKESVRYNGKKLSRYEAEQNLREIERTIRKYKRQAVTLESANLDATSARVKLGEWQAKANDFIKQTGLKRDRVREWIGTKDGVQPKGINTATFNYSKNLEKAYKIKRLEKTHKKEVVGVKKSKPMNFTKADNGAPNPNYGKGKGFEENCQSCVVAYELRRRGFNVQTLPNVDGSMLDVLSSNTSLAWIDRTTGTFPKYIEPKAKTCKQAFYFLENNLKLNNRYTIEFAWKKSTCGHIIHIYKDKSGLKLYDPQSDKKYYGLSVLRYLTDVKPTTIQLLDVEKCDINLSVVNKILEASK